MQNTDLTKPSLRDYFQAVDRRLERQGVLPRAAVRVRLAGHLLELRFQDQTIAREALQYLAAQAVPQSEEPPEATLLYWYHDQADCAAYLPAGAGTGSAVWRSRDDTGFLQITTDSDTLLGVDLARRRYYCASRRPPRDAAPVFDHTPVSLFSLWSDNSGLFLLHAAAVGVEGQGVLVAGRSGEGKSTFAVSCLFAGLDFVSDDYAFLTAQGAIEALPLYTSLSVRPDMYARLPGLGSPLVPSNPRWQDGKVQFPVPPGRLTPSLPIRAILLPVLDGGEGDPFFTPAATDSAFVRLLYSTARQLSRERDTALIRQMAARLGDLPVLEMHMSTDLTKNPAALRRAIIKKEI